MNLYLVEGSVQVSKQDGEGYRFSHVEYFKYVVKADGQYDAEIQVEESFRKKNDIGKFEYQDLQFTVWPSIND
ncbi:Uncharacterised protein [Escherichia coli]|uniref:Uncharacterized protein n=1 Tax=Escherichia phage fEgEco12 TaxID=3158837 RepID=A0AAU7PI10_9CAUD|nr:hypothetical protein [Escherichia coli]MED6536660.1 hypothetical protein [Escherichia coli O157]QAY00850.1 hypothetical protein Ecwhy1_578 [Escherichia phage Ecwhy_1]QXN76509.1 hypothetical protein [Escherichia phage BF17]WGM49763.1 hypothetical protein EcMJ_521 [Escherichia phage vB_Ec-M-J]EFJ0711415.1 hypothetical protein [Escherichia coli]